MTDIIKTSKWIALAGLLAAVGCQSPAPSTTQANGVRSDVTDIRPMESASLPAYQPTAVAPAGFVVPSAPVQPVTPDASSTATAMTISNTTYSSTPMMSTGSSGSHIVRRGETMYSIARETYGNGKQWQKIAMANPSASPSGLRVGQTLIIP